jgi:hypothetical protein
MIFDFVVLSIVLRQKTKRDVMVISQQKGENKSKTMECFGILESLSIESCAPLVFSACN